MRLPSSSSFHTTKSDRSSSSISSRRQALLARLATEREDFSQACAQVSGSKYFSGSGALGGLSNLIMQAGLKGIASQWLPRYQLAKIAIPFLLSTPYLRSALLKFVGKRAWPLIKWGLVGFTVWKGALICLKALSSTNKSK